MNLAIGAGVKNCPIAERAAREVALLNACCGNWCLRSRQTQKLRHVPLNSTVRASAKPSGSADDGGLFFHMFCGFPGKILAWGGENPVTWA